MKETFVFSTLQRKPELKNKTLKLIEESFKYEKHFDFSVDFAPLVSDENSNHCHIVFIQETQEVVAHIGFLRRDLLVQKSSFPVGLLGGICVSEKYQGHGLFKKLFSKILSFYQDSVSMFMLWSDKVQLYEKHGFHLCIEQKELGKEENKPLEGFEKTKYYLLEIVEKVQVKKLYRDHILSQCSSFQRTEKDWRALENITSSDLYIKREEGRIVGYFFMNKGQDLQGIIHEIAIEDGHDEITGHGTAWLSPAHKHNKDSQLHYASLVKIANVEIFRKMIYDYSNEEVIINSIQNNEVSFYFKKQKYSFPIDRFLTGIWGPNSFEEFQFKAKPLYISGLDSI